eukprot:g7134.t1
MGLRIFPSKVALKSVAGSSAVSVLVLTVSGVEFASSSGGCSVSSLLGVLLMWQAARLGSRLCSRPVALPGSRGFAYLPKKPLPSGAIAEPYIRTKYGMGQFLETLNRKPFQVVGLAIAVMFIDTLCELMPYGESSEEWFNKQARKCSRAAKFVAQKMGTQVKDDDE